MKYGILFAAMALLLTGQDKARAAAITYTEQAIASGSIGAVGFQNTLVTITSTGDTANTDNPQGVNCHGDQ